MNPRICIFFPLQSFSQILLISIGLVCSSMPAFANDSEAAFGVGGLVLKKSAHIAMLSEELFVSHDQIVVKYRFENTAANDVNTIVGFPLPEIKYDPDDSHDEYGFSFDRFDGFATSVEGEAAQTNINDKAVLHGKDETQTLNYYGIEVDPRDAYKQLALSTDNKTTQKLRQLTLIDDRGYPLWSLIRTYYWEQRFPARAVVSIEHRYKPMVGGSSVTGLNVLAAPHRQREYEKFCVDQSFLDAVRKRTKVPDIKEDGHIEGWTETWIEYVLVTGRNWLGPIRKFRLVVDKGHPENLVSFCGSNVRKIGPTQFELTATDFVPSQDLFVLILEPRRPLDGADDERNDISALSCEELWLRRNSIFKTGGYCFKSKNAISHFGNAGCLYDDVARVPLSNADRTSLDRIRAFERAKHCQN